MPIRLCIDAPCGEPAVYRGRCRTHARGRERDTHPNKSFYNSKRWAMTRRRYLFDHPLCEHGGCMEVATDVHHRQDIQAGGDPWSMENLEALCHPHHSMETRARQATQ